MDGSSHEDVLKALRERDDARAEMARLRYGSQQAARDAFIRDRVAAATRERDQARQQLLAHILGERGEDAMRQEAAARGWEYLLDVAQ